MSTASAFSHEDPILVLLPPSERVEQALGTILSHPDIRHVHLPPLWCLDKAGIDLPAALPVVRSITVENLPEVVGVLLRLCTQTQLDALVERAWAEAEERVRQHYLSLGIGQTFATIFRMAPRSIDRSPPALFRSDRVHDNGFEVQYRLPAPEAAPDFRAPEHEGTLVLYPFDPTNAAGCEEAGVEPGDGAVLEAFAYEPARVLHREFLEGVAAQNGWRVVDPRLTAS